MPSSAAADSAPPPQMPAFRARSLASSQKTVGNCRTPSPWERAASRNGATGSSPRLPISTSTWTPSDAHAIRKIAANRRW